MKNKFKYAPDNNKKSFFLYCGRSSDIEYIVTSIMNGKSVGLFAEQKGGKTLTLKILESIINGHVNSVNSKFIDDDLSNNFSKWNDLLINYKAMHVSISGTRNEEQIINEIMIRNIVFFIFIHF